MYRGSDDPYLRANDFDEDQQWSRSAADSCPTCGADLDDGECEECERAAPLDFDT